MRFFATSDEKTMKVKYPLNFKNHKYLVYECDGEEFDNISFTKT